MKCNRHTICNSVIRRWVDCIFPTVALWQLRQTGGRVHKDALIKLIDYFPTPPKTSVPTTSKVRSLRWNGYIAHLANHADTRAPWLEQLKPLNKLRSFSGQLLIHLNYQQQGSQSPY